MTTKRDGRNRRSSDGLTARQLRFVEQYLLDLNATQAAIRAGYSPKHADVSGPRLLGHVGIAAAIQKAMDARATRTGISADRVLRETEIVSFSDIEYFTVDEAGRLHVTEHAPEGATRAVARKKFKVTTKEIPMKGGEPMVITERETEIALWNKPEMLKLAGRHVDVHGFSDRLEVTGKNGRPIQVEAVRAETDTDLIENTRQLAERLAAAIGALPRLGARK